jgi:hypothetical protein
VLTGITANPIFPPLPDPFGHCHAEYAKHKEETTALAAAQHNELAQLQQRHDELAAQLRNEAAAAAATAVTPFLSRAAPEASTRKSAVRPLRIPSLFSSVSRSHSPASLPRTQVRRALDDMAAIREASAAPAGAKRVGEGSNEALLSAQGFAAKRAAIQHAVDETLATLASGGGDGDEDDDATRLGGDLRSPAAGAATPFRSPRAAAASAAASAAKIVAAELGVDPTGADALRAPMKESEEFLAAYGVNPTKLVLLKVQSAAF